MFSRWQSSRSRRATSSSENDIIHGIDSIERNVNCDGLGTGLSRLQVCQAENEKNLIESNLLQSKHSGWLVLLCFSLMNYGQMEALLWRFSSIQLPHGFHFIGHSFPWEPLYQQHDGHKGESKFRWTARTKSIENGLTVRLVCDNECWNVQGDFRNDNRNKANDMTNDEDKDMDDA